MLWNYFPMLNGRVCVRLNLQLFMTLKFYGVPKAPKMCIENISLTIFDIVWSSRSYLIPLTLFVRKYPSLICWPWKLWWKPCNEKIFSLIVQTIKSKNYYCITFVVRSFNYQIIIIWNQKKYFVYWINYQNYVILYFVDS